MIKFIIFMNILVTFSLHGMKRSADETFNNESNEQIYFPLEQLPTELLIAITEQSMPEHSPEVDRLLAQIRMLASFRTISKTLHNLLPFNIFHTTFKRYSPKTFEAPEILWNIVGANANFIAHDTAILWLKTLLHSGANPNAQWQIIRKSLFLTQYFEGHTLLGIATRCGSTTCMRVLIDAGANPSTLNGSCPPLFFVHNNEQLDILLQAGADINQTDNKGKTALHSAASYFNGMKITEKLLHAGALVNTRDHNQNTPLHYASCAGVAASIQILLNAGANPKIPNHNGDTPLHVAAKLYRRGVVMTLLQAGVQKNILNNNNQTPVQVALAKEAFWEIMSQGVAEANKLSTLIDTWPQEEKNNEED